MKHTFKQLQALGLLIAVTAMFYARQTTAPARKAITQRLRDDRGAVSMEQAVVTLFLVVAAAAGLQIIRTKIVDQAEGIEVQG